MAKKYYQTLEISEETTPEDIKKSYRKLAQKWHPDKWSSKSLKERKQANEMMQEVNKAYEILSDGEKRRKYDLGLTDFPVDDFNYQYDPKEEIRRQKEELRRREVNITDLELKILKLEMKALDRSSTINEIGAAFCFTLPRVHAEDLDPILWKPYQSWGEKVVKMEINIPKNKERSEELRNFKEEMIKAIKQLEIALRIREENKKKSEDDFELNQARTVAFQEIEKSINEKGLKVKDLEQYSNYQERINGLGEVWEIRNFREEVLGYVSELGRKESERKRENEYRLTNNRPRENPYNPYPPMEQPNYWLSNNPNFPNDSSRLMENPNYLPWSNPNPRFPDRTDFPRPEPERVPNRQNKPWNRVEEGRMDNSLSGIRYSKYDNWTREELVDEIERERLTSDRLNKHISFLESKNKKLEEAIQALKVATPQTSWVKQIPFIGGLQKNQQAQIQIPPKK